MSSYQSVLKTAPVKKKPKRRIFLWILLAVLILIIIAVIINLKTIMLATGKGSIDVNSLPQIKTLMNNSALFNQASETTNSQGDHIISSTSKDGAVAITVTQNSNGGRTVNAEINLKALNTNGYSKSDLLKGNVTAIQKAKAQADQYLELFIDKSETTGIETYILNQAVSQHNNKADLISIDHVFGNTHVSITGDLAENKATMHITE